MQEYLFSNVKNIIFDFGGVILNIDYNLSAEAFKQLGVENFEKHYSKAEQTALFDGLEKGTTPYEHFCDSIRAISNKSISNQQIDAAWNAMLLDLPKERLAFLLQLKAKYRTFLLSNTNEKHFEGFTANLQKEHGVESLDLFFEKAYYSHIIQLRKPHREVFDFVINENNLNPAETLFIDDTEHHVKGAIAAGLQGHWLRQGEDIVTLLHHLL